MVSSALKDEARHGHNLHNLCAPQKTCSSFVRLISLLFGILLVRLCATHSVTVTPGDLLEALARAHARAEAEAQPYESKMVVKVISSTSPAHIGGVAFTGTRSLTLHRSAHLIGVTSPSNPDINWQGRQGRIQTADSRSVLQRHVVLPAGVRLDIEGLTVVSLHIGQGREPDGNLASLVAGWLLDKRSQGTLTLADVVLEFASCEANGFSSLVQAPALSVTGKESHQGGAAKFTTSMLHAGKPAAGADPSVLSSSSSDGSSAFAQPGITRADLLPDPARPQTFPASQGGLSHLRGTPSSGGQHLHLSSARSNPEPEHLSTSNLKHASDVLETTLGPGRPSPLSLGTTATSSYLIEDLQLQLPSDGGHGFATVLLHNTQVRCNMPTHVHMTSDDSASDSGSSDSGSSDSGSSDSGGGTDATKGSASAAAATAASSDSVPSSYRRRRLLAAVSGQWPRGRNTAGGSGGAGAAAAAAAGLLQGEVLAAEAAGTSGAGASGRGRGSLAGGFWGQQFVAVALMLVVVGGVWLRRLLSCACMAPPKAAAPSSPDAHQRAEQQAGSRPMGKTSTTVFARSSQNHTLSALSRFSAQLRKGEDGSFSRTGALRGAGGAGAGGADGNNAADGSFAGGGGGGGAHPLSAAAAVLPPQLLKDLSELKSGGQQGRLATSLHGLWQQQQRVVVKVMSHGEECCFMLEQVGEVWTRLTHPNIVACFAAETLPATSLAAVPADVAQLLPKPVDPVDPSPSSSSLLLTWLVLERCENGSLASLLALRHQQQLQARKAAAAADSGAGGDGKHVASHLARRLGRFSRGRRRSSQPSETHGSVGEAAPGMVHPHGPPPAPTAFPAAITSRPSAEESELPPPPLALPAAGVPVMSSQGQGQLSASLLKPPQQQQQQHAAGDRGGSPGSSGSEEGGESALPGLLPVVEVLSIAHDVASGLAYLHSLDLCHGDVRAENVLLQTLVLPSGARSASALGDYQHQHSGDGRMAITSAADEARNAGSGNAGDGAVMGINGGSIAAAAGVSTVKMVGMQYYEGGMVPLDAAAVGRNRRDDEALALAYGRASVSDMTDMSGVYGGSGGVGVGPRQTVSNNSSYACTLQGSSTVPESSVGHPWSSSLRNLNGFMPSTYASTAMGIAPPHGVGVSAMRGSGAPVSSGFDTVSMDERMMPAGSLNLNGGMPGSSGYDSQLGFGASGFGRRGVGNATSAYGGNGGGSRSQLSIGASSGNGCSSAHRGMQGAAAAEVPGGAASAGMQTDGNPRNPSSSSGAPPLSPSSAAVAALARGFGGGSYQPLAAACSLPVGALSNGPYSSRRQSTSSLSPFTTSAQLLNGCNEAPPCKAPSNLAAWPESPLEGRHVASSSTVMFGSGGGGGGGAAGTESPTDVGGGGGRSVTGYTRALSSGLPSFRRFPAVGGLRSALAGPEPLPAAAAVATTVPRPSPLPQPPPPSSSDSPRSAVVIAAAVAANSVRRASDAPAPDTPTAPRRPPPLSLEPLTGEVICASGPLTSAATAAADAVIASPQCITVQISPANSGMLPSPRESITTTTAAAAAAGAATAATSAATVVHDSALPSTDPGALSGAPSTPTTPATLSPVPGNSSSGGGIGAGSRSRPSSLSTAAGCIPTHQGRRCSAPPVVSLPVIRRVAKLSDPWLSLARMPADCAGGPWLPEAAAAVGATSGADVSHLPPELLLSGRLHPSSDVYSLAILLWRMLSSTGEAPYGKLQPAEVSYKVVACGMRPAFSPAVPEPLRRLVEDCWQSDPAARPTVPQVLQRLTELQAQAPLLQRQWRERHALFGAVSTVPISAVAVLPLHGEQNDVAARWAEAAGIRLLRTSASFGGGGGAVGGGGGGSSASATTSFRGGEGSGHTSFVRASSLHGTSGTYAGGLSYQSGGFSGAAACVNNGNGSGSAAHLYQQPHPPTPPPLSGFAGLHAHASQFSELSNHSRAASDSQHQQPQSQPPQRNSSTSNHHQPNGAHRTSQSNYQSVSPFQGHLPHQSSRRTLAELA
ncbi:hypothetical protein Agub_g13732 [Astrephomene gubernaculifera]|uniref:Serine-threonine/tyrosine-protein kinase catalytic domain-containing protein n=1 Tax=Astrephomene gubernaculifera TaxID=47775 RepID=A0AAD3HRS7_9CHLO|nr:hypothetical protein Agub_g13732 [Astrephomene gubernaculifera]